MYQKQRRIWTYVERERDVCGSCTFLDNIKFEEFHFFIHFL